MSCLSAVQTKHKCAQHISFGTSLTAAFIVVLPVMTTKPTSGLHFGFSVLTYFHSHFRYDHKTMKVYFFFHSTRGIAYLGWLAPSIQIYPTCKNIHRLIYTFSHKHTNVYKYIITHIECWC